MFAACLKLRKPTQLMDPYGDNISPHLGSQKEHSEDSALDPIFCSCLSGLERSGSVVNGSYSIIQQIM
ncbi:hypothetical protein SS50377_27139 [Spironucleus salmonicida]|uniref:Uncharacterized protein n=1 Tax=Spironucleus salmonicida TaxID=348837 RepID=V6LSI9_9EUKA|nr:hypothetical protein SS50377_27139 [Spironucleus salmonicida]|eukprot:EST43734.1 Hypothetical protein SS50377_16466 [Spironucleus salmonicida]